jgi:hypothetical protein
LPSSRYIALRSKWVEPAFPPKLDGVHGLGLIRNIRVVCCDSSSPSYIHQLCIKEDLVHLWWVLFLYWKIDIAVINNVVAGLGSGLRFKSKLRSHVSF